MIPSVQARQIELNLLDYVRASLDLSEPEVQQALHAHLAAKDGLFQGPYVRLGLPFQSVPTGTPLPIEIGPPFAPYAHQLQSFQQLGSSRPHKNTLVTTGTGSGKTECFLYPILDHCHRNRHQPGVQAILIYPMNALATDQARRFAQVIHEDARLKGLRVGLYVGGQGGTKVMGPEQVIEDKQVLRKHPPQILLTNYKMLDFMLLRPDERRLWECNTAETLRYLVIDELHTFDGAQGSDVACLIRRLKERLGTPKDHLICAGTSATIGSSTDPQAFADLCNFAGTVFEEDFHPQDVVKESRVARDQFLRAPSGPTPLPGGKALAALAPGPDAQAWLRLQIQLWLGCSADDPRVTDPVALGDALLEHPLLSHLLSLCAAGPRPMDQLMERLTQRLPELGHYDATQQRALLDSFLALVSRARVRQGKTLRPLITVQVQLWTRELTRLLRALPDQSREGGLHPSFAWWSDLPELPGVKAGQDEHGTRYGAQAHCWECGIAGFACAETENDRANGRLSWDPADVGKEWLEGSSYARFLWPRPLDKAEREGELIYWLDPNSGTIDGKVQVDEKGQHTGVPVILEQRVRGQESKRFAAQCPACDSEDALRIVGARAASLSSVVVSQLFQSDYNQDPKLLAFTDSVQDACHRAGFFGGRTYRIHMRVSMQAVLRAHGGRLSLDKAGQAFVEHWRKEKDPAWTMAAFLPPDLREIPEFVHYLEKKGRGAHKRLWQILTERMGWEFVREYGYMASLGRSLERTGTSTLQVDPVALATVADRFAQWLEQDGLAGPNGLPEHFLDGLLHRMRLMGAVHHPYLDRYAGSLGNRYLLSRKQNPHISGFPPRGRVPRFVSSWSRGKRFPSPFAKRAHLGWYGDWMARTLDWGTVSPDQLQRVYKQALDLCTEQGILQARQAEGGAQVWGFDPASLTLTTQVGLVLDGPRHVHLPTAQAQQAAGKPPYRYRAPSPYQAAPLEPGYYAQVYSREQSARVLPGEHTGLLERGPRTLLEQRFLASPDPGDALAPNLLVCTPTLEMGVDIGDLSATLLCSVPPTPANYLQRVGRAGRKTGNALIFALATAQPHDLYFFAAPERMLDGVVQTPGVFLGATAMLRRQLSAWCMDRWAQEDPHAKAIPHRANLILGEGAAVFPGRFVDYLVEHRESLLAGFLERFAPWLRPESTQALSAWVRADKGGLKSAFPQAFADLAQSIKDYQSERDRAAKRIKKLQADPTLVGDAPQEIQDLERYRRVLSQLIQQLRRSYPLNVLAKESLLPNYAFPEAGVELHSLLGGAAPDADGNSEKRRYDKRTYVRPAARALRELAPFNTFYAEGHKVTIKELELGPKASHVQHHRLCPSCHHRSLRPVDPSAPCTDAACPKCGHPGWADKGQVRGLLPLTTVRSLSDRVRSTTVDDSEERSRESYHIHQGVQVLTLDGAAVMHSELGFGFEYASQVLFTELNMGFKSALETAPKVNIAGEVASAEGFMVCSQCGSVHDTRSSKSRQKDPSHSYLCKQRDKNNKPLQPLYLMRELRSEAVRFLMPFSEVEVDSKHRSFQAALSFGLRRRFQGRPIHLAVGTMSEPVPGNPDQRKYYLVLLDTVPGGTGYLREYKDAHQVFELLQLALDGLRACPCRKEGRDGCYLCLFAHHSQRHLPQLSSAVAEKMLAEILADRRKFHEVDGGLSGTKVDNVLESELEERFIAWLHSLDVPFKEKESGLWDLDLGESAWQLQAQVDVSAEAGQGSRADFVLLGTKGPALNRRVVVECDGFKYHVKPEHPQSRLEDDVRKRVALAGRDGWQVFSLTWRDLHPKHASGHGPAALCDISAQVWEKMYLRACKSLPAELHPVLAKLHSLSPQELLLAYLRAPSQDWEKMASALAHAAAVDALVARQSLDAWSVDKLQLHLQDAGALLPLPPSGIQPAPGAGAPVARVSENGACVTLLKVSESKLLTALKPSSPQVLMRLDDTHPQRQSDGFLAAWQAFLQGMNLLQFLPNVEYILSSTVLDNATAAPDDELDILAELGLSDQADMAAESPSFEQPPGANAVQELCEALMLDAQTQELLTELVAQGAELPDTEPPDLPNGIPAELVWSAQRLALCRQDDLDEEDPQTLRDAGWNYLLLPQRATTVLRALKDSQ